LIAFETCISQVLKFAGETGILQLILQSPRKCAGLEKHLKSCRIFLIPLDSPEKFRKVAATSAIQTEMRNPSATSAENQTFHNTSANSSFPSILPVYCHNVCNTKEIPHSAFKFCDSQTILTTAVRLRTFPYSV
jgi:hypothetical protein